MKLRAIRDQSDEWAGANGLPPPYGGRASHKHRAIGAASRPPASGGGAAGAAQGDSPAVVRLQVILDRRRIRVADRRAERLDHLGDLGVPGGGAHERRVHLDVVEAVAGGAIATASTTSR